MLIKISGGSSGIREYLEEGRKAGRELSRDEIDNRLPLTGDLDFTDSVIQSMTNEGEKYLHITLAFKEDEVSEEILRSVTAEFEQFAMSASDSDEYVFYAEAHLPKQKSYVHAQTGELVERKPHIHIVIPKTNLMSGQHLNPLGMIEHQKEFIDAFQERINSQYGFASPKDNRRTETTPQSELISRYKGDQFKGIGSDLKVELLDTVLDQDIQTVADFEKLLSGRGEIRTRNAGKSNEYINLKETGAAKGVNLKDYVFSREFIELPTDQKKAILSKEAAKNYVSVGEARPSIEQLDDRLNDWHSRRALEVKYLNSGSKIYKTYQAADPEQKQQILAGQRAKFYTRWREPDVPLELKLTPPVKRSQHAAHALQLAGKLEYGDLPPDHPKNFSELKTLGSLKTLNSLGRFSEVKGLSELEHYQGKSVLIEPPQARYTNSVLDRYSADLRDRQLSRKDEMTLIKRELDASRLLNQLSHSHGVIVEKYTISQGKDGGDRIQCGTRNLNVSDFLTKELNLPWQDASKILRDCYDQQQGKEPSQGKQLPHKNLWNKYQSERPILLQQRQQAWQQQLISERKRRAKLKDVYLASRGQTQGNRALTPAERKAAVSVARMERIAGEAALREVIKLERDTLKETYPTVGSAQYSQWLHQQAEKGDSAALNELRRRENQAQAKEEAPKEKAAGELKSTAPAKTMSLISAFSYEISKRGDVTYTDRQGKMLRDSSDRVSVLRTDEQAVSVSLKLAQQKFYAGGKVTELDVGGSPEFKRMAVEIAVKEGLKVTFTDKLMENLRLELLQDKLNSGQSSHAISEPQGNKLVAHGVAPFENDPEKRDSYFVTVEDKSGNEHTVWGVDLKRAVENSGAQIGDKIKLEHAGVEEVKLPNGKLAQRNRWKAKVVASEVQKIVEKEKAKREKTRKLNKGIGM